MLNHNLNSIFSEQSKKLSYGIQTTDRHSIETKLSGQVGSRTAMNDLIILQITNMPEYECKAQDGLIGHIKMF